MKNGSAFLQQTAALKTNLVLKKTKFDSIIDGVLFQFK